jgi:hypothetical protein
VPSTTTSVGVAPPDGAQVAEFSFARGLIDFADDGRFGARVDWVFDAGDDALTYQKRV